MWTAEEIAAVVGGRVLRSDPTKPIRGVSVDSRTVRPGDLFVALPGTRTDGHLYLSEAFARGAHGALIAADKLIHLPEIAEEGGRATNCIAVPDPLTALQELARAHRQRFGIPVVGITGSSGKTTTKELLAALLSERYRTYWSPGNYNSEIGLPLALLEMPAEAEVGVFELALQRPGDIALLAGILRPTIGLLTAIGDAHLGFFRDREELARAKWALVESLPEDAWAVLNLDTPFVADWIGSLTCRTVGFGIDHPDATVRAVGIEDTSCEGLSFEIVTPTERFPIRTPLLGRLNVYNVLGAVATARELGVPVSRIQRALAHARPVPHRLELKRSRRYGLLLDDTYNANPTSVRAALQTLIRLRVPDHRKVVILGDMRELGPHAVELHRELAAPLAATDEIDRVFTIGPLAEETARALADRGGSWADRVESASTLEELYAQVRARLRSRRNLILIKGSRALRLERLVAKMLP